MSSPVSSDDETEQQNQEEEEMKAKIVPAELKRKEEKMGDIELLLQGVDLEVLGF